MGLRGQGVQQQDLSNFPVQIHKACESGAGKELAECALWGLTLVSSLPFPSFTLQGSALWSQGHVTFSPSNPFLISFPSYSSKTVPESSGIPGSIN